MINIIIQCKWESNKTVTYYRREAQFHQVTLAVFVSKFAISQIAVLRLPRQCTLATATARVTKLTRACEPSGKRSRAGRKSGERERSGEQTFQKTLERERSMEREATERRAGVTKKAWALSGKSATHSPLICSYVTQHFSEIHTTCAIPVNAQTRSTMSTFWDL